MTEDEQLDLQLRIIRDSDLEQRFWDHVRWWSMWNGSSDDPIDEQRCWFWEGSTTRPFGVGYGRFRVWDRVMLAHRYSYMRWNGWIDPWLEIDHLCGHKGCVNPRHLEAVTHDVNVRRARSFVRDAWVDFRLKATPKRASA